VNPPATPLKIGQVHALLRREHPNLELSKIRYYEEMGLVAPARSRKGYRLYSDKDVACLREAIRLADEEFVPLRVIRVRLMEKGLLRDEHHLAPATRPAARSAQSRVVSLSVPSNSAPNANSTPHSMDPTIPNLVALRDGDTTTAPPSTPAPLSFLSASQLLEASGVEPELLNKILALGLLTPVSHGRETSYNALDVQVVRAAASLMRNGADPRQLGALRRVVEREVGILDALTSDVRVGPSTPSEVQRVKVEVASDIEALRALLFEQALQDYLNS
jgi:DNA-binding transcriptional MerR regulator